MCTVHISIVLGQPLVSHQQTGLTSCATRVRREPMMESQAPVKQASRSSFDDLGAWWYTVISYLDYQRDRKSLFRCSKQHAVAALTHPGLCKTLHLRWHKPELHVSAVSFVNMCGKDLRLCVDDMEADQLRIVLAEAAAKSVQQQPVVSPAQVNQLNAITSVRLCSVQALPSLVPDFIMEHCPSLTKLKLIFCTVQSLPAEGTALKSWPQLQALTVHFVELDAAAAQVTQQLQCLPGLHSLDCLHQDVSKWSGVPGLLGSRLTALSMSICDHHLMPEGCVYLQLQHLHMCGKIPSEQWARLHDAAPALTHLFIGDLTIDQLAGLPISWASQLERVSCRELVSSGVQPLSTVAAVLSAIGTLHLGDADEDDRTGPSLYYLPGCSSEMWAAVMPHLQCEAQDLNVIADRAFSRSDVSLMGQRLTCDEVKFFKASFEPGVLGSLLRLMPRVCSLSLSPTDCTVGGLAALICTADRPVSITIFEDELQDLHEDVQEILDDALAECGHDYVRLIYE